MGIITTAVDDNVEKEFRKFVNAKYGKRKGVLGKATTEAYRKLMESDEQEQARRNALAILNKGFNLGRRLWKTRDDIYADRINSIIRRH